MAGLEQEPSATDAALKADRAGSTMITIGWILIGFDCVSAIFLWVGLGGSVFWVCWVIAEGIAALILIWLGGRKKMQARSSAENANRR